jgi:hypothetical protein
MRRRGVAGVVVGTAACVWLFAGWTRAAAHVQDPGAQDRTAALQMFAEGVERYAALRTRYEAPLPPFDIRRDPWSLQLSRHFLASAIRTARHQARPGDVFTPPVARVIRQLIAEAYDIDLEGLADEELDAADVIVDLTLNEPVPSWAMRELPDVLSAHLPRLPPAIEYRLVSDALILWDAHAEILIDVLPGAPVVP